MPGLYPILTILPNPPAKPVHRKAKLLSLILIGRARFVRWAEGSTTRAPDVSGLRAVATAVAINPAGRRAR
jgi:hypothetical protein